MSDKAKTTQPIADWMQDTLSAHSKRDRTKSGKNGETVRNITRKDARNVALRGISGALGNTALTSGLMAGAVVCTATGLLPVAIPLYAAAAYTGVQAVRGGKGTIAGIAGRMALGKAHKISVAEQDANTWDKTAETINNASNTRQKQTQQAKTAPEQESNATQVPTPQAQAHTAAQGKRRSPTVTIPTTAAQEKPAPQADYSVRIDADNSHTHTGITNTKDYQFKEFLNSILIAPSQEHGQNVIRIQAGKRAEFDKFLAENSYEDVANAMSNFMQEHGFHHDESKGYSTQQLKTMSKQLHTIKTDNTLDPLGKAKAFSDMIKDAGCSTVTYHWKMGEDVQLDIKVPMPTSPHSLNVFNAAKAAGVLNGMEDAMDFKNFYAAEARAAVLEAFEKNPVAMHKHAAQFIADKNAGKTSNDPMVTILKETIMDVHRQKQNAMYRQEAQASLGYVGMKDGSKDPQGNPIDPRAALEKQFAKQATSNDHDAPPTQITDAQARAYQQQLVAGQKSLAAASR